MSSVDLSSVRMTDEEIFDLLKTFLAEITSHSGEITMDTLLIDELGLDSLGFLDLFFTIQTSIQKEVTNDQMRMLIAEELSVDRSPDFASLSDGEKDRMLYPKLKVRNFFNIIKKQLDGGIAGLDIEEQSDRLLQSGVVDNFIASGFEDLKNAKLEEYLKNKNIKDPGLEKAVRAAFDEVTAEKVKDLVHDKRIVQNIVRDFLKRHIGTTAPEFLKKHLDPHAPEEMRQKFLSGEDISLGEAHLSQDQIMLNMYRSVLKDMEGSESQELTDLSDFSDRLLKALQKEPQKLAEVVMQNQMMQEMIIREVIETRIDDIFESEIQKQAGLVNDKELSEFVKTNFFTASFKLNSMEKYLDPDNAHAEIIKKVMSENFDSIVAKETERIVQDTELRNRLIQEYIRDNYDPMQAMELNTPEKMRELQRKITQKYVDENMDEIMGRYMEEYMQLYMDTMLESMPEEDEIEVSGDAQDEFMKNFVDRMHKTEDSSHAPKDKVLEFVARYGVDDPLLLSFMETNFDEMTSYFAHFEKMQYSQSEIEAWLMNHFGVLESMYLLFHLEEVKVDPTLRQDFLSTFLKNHFDDLMELSIRRQFEGGSGADLFTEEENKKYAALLNDVVKNRLSRLIQDTSIQEMERQILNKASAKTMEEVLEIFANQPYADQHIDWFCNLYLKYSTEVNETLNRWFQSSKGSEHMAGLIYLYEQHSSSIQPMMEVWLRSVLPDPKAQWFFDMHQSHPEVFSRMPLPMYHILLDVLPLCFESWDTVVLSSLAPELGSLYKDLSFSGFSESLKRVKESRIVTKVLNHLLVDKSRLSKMKLDLAGEILKSGNNSPLESSKLEQEFYAKRISEIAGEGN